MGDVKTKRRAHVVLPEDLLTKIDELVGKRERSHFIAEVLEAEVRRRRLLAALEGMEGSLADVDIPGTQRPESRTPEQRLPFAPCAGIYISPLQDNSETEDEEGYPNRTCEEPDSSQRRSHNANKLTARSPVDGFSTVAKRSEVSRSTVLLTDLLTCEIR